MAIANRVERAELIEEINRLPEKYIAQIFDFVEYLQQETQKEGADLGSSVPTKPVKHSAFGRLKAFANPSLMQEEEGAWEKATAEKYALR
ncbi:MAG: DUF2281 domain-containing protein [Treponema sp.]|nr:DUF2281 domain-containing protein [Treponema sp.]